jgi:hypothetical protein
MKMPYGFQDFNKNRAAREKIFLPRFFAGPRSKTRIRTWAEVLSPCYPKAEKFPNGAA